MFCGLFFSPKKNNTKKYYGKKRETWEDGEREAGRAEATRSELGGAYEGCLDQFERGMSTERLREVFGELKAGLVPLLRAIQDKVELAHRASGCATFFFVCVFFVISGKMDTFWACPIYFCFVLWRGVAMLTVSLEASFFDGIYATVKHENSVFTYVLI